MLVDSYGVVTVNTIKQYKPRKEKIYNISELEAYKEFELGKRKCKLVSVPIPYKMVTSWSKQDVYKITCNEKIANNVYNIFMEVLRFYGLNKIKELGLNIYGGCYNNRIKRNGLSKSMHSLSIAIDINPLKNRLHWGEGKAVMSRNIYIPFWNIVNRHGGFSCGLIKGYDYMHFQFCNYSRNK